MPYRALLATFVTVGLALLAVGMWAAVVGPMVTGTSPTDVSGQQLRTLTRAVLILSFLLIVTLLVIGLLATVRAWSRMKRPGRKRIRTKYVDAWKLAGERMEPKPEDKSGPEQPGG